MRAIRNSLILFVALICVVAACDDPAAPPDPLPEFPEMDTTSHDYSWEFFSFGRKGFANTVTGVWAISDSDIWITGRIPLEEPLITYPTGLPSNYANLIHWDGRKLEYFSIAGKVGESGIGPYIFQDILHVDGRIWLMTGVGYTELVDDTVRIIQFDSYRSIVGYENSEIGKSRRIYLWSEVRGLAYMKSHSSKDVIVVDTQSSDDIIDFEEIDTDDYLLIRFNRSTITRWIQRITRGISMVVVSHESDEMVGYTGSRIWTGDKYFFIGGTKYIYIQSIKDDRVYKAMLNPLNVPAGEIYGKIVASVGRSESDVFFAGHYATVVHYNGKSLRRYSEFFHDDNRIIPRGMSITSNSVVVSGEVGNTGLALLAIGRKR